LADISWKSRYALMKHDWIQLGRYFQTNISISEQIMKHCGFNFGIGWANKLLIELIKEEPGVYAVKLSGAGGGGSVFALVNPSQKQLILNKWCENLQDILQTPEIIRNRFPNIPETIIKKLSNALFFSIQLNTNGVENIAYPNNIKIIKEKGESF
jgi:hypothetical protein